VDSGIRVEAGKVTSKSNTDEALIIDDFFKRVTPLKHVQTNYPILLTLCPYRTYELTSNNRPNLVIHPLTTLFPYTHPLWEGPTLQLQALLFLSLFPNSPNTLLLVTNDF
jgi:hypothetical protein